MDRAERERLIALISWGKISVNSTLNDGSRVTIILRPATSEDLAMATIVYNEAYVFARTNGLMSEEEAMALYTNTGAWSSEFDAQIAGLKKDIYTMKRGLLDFLFNTDRLEKTRSAIRRAEKALVDKIEQRSSLLNDTIESYSAMAQQRYLIGCVAHMVDGSKFFDDIDTSNEHAIIKQLVTIFFLTSRYSERVLREIARTDPWRFMWNAGKIVSRIFNGNPIEWGYNQAELVRWSHLYDMVFDSYDRPSSLVVNDDDLLDSWIIRQNEKSDSSTKQKESEGILNISNTQSGRQEVFVVTDRNSASRVYDMNTPVARRTIKRNQEIISGSHEISDAHLPNSQAEMRELAMAKSRERIRR
jgi:hypothetical protein